MHSPTPAQQQAIDHESGNLLILACAGSGKTETLARRIARMVQQGAHRASIVAFTFTEHAADELKHRIRARLEDISPDEPSLGDMYVGTIHSFCLRVLRELSPHYRLFQVMDETRQAALIAANFVRFEDAGIGLDRLRSRTRSGTYGETLRTFLNTLNVIHQQRLDFEQIEDPTLAETIRYYQEIAYGPPNYFFDFNKIIDELISYFENHSDALSQYRETLTHVFVDEYQDVDDRQEHLIRLLSNSGFGPQITAVGDDDQALYGFRGASVRNILTFHTRYPDVVRVNLDANFRSTHAIVSISDEAVRAIPERIVKEPVARKVLTDEEAIECMADLGDIQLRTFGTEEQEAEWTADRIQELRGVAIEEANGSTRGLDYGDMAILLRSVRNSGSVFAEALRKREIPVVISGTRGLFNNDEVRLIQAGFCILARADFGLRDADGKFHLLTTVETREFIREKIVALRGTNRLGPNANSTHFLSRLDQIRADLDQRSLPREERAPRKGARIYPQAIYQTLLQALGGRLDEWPVDLMFNLGAFSRLLNQFEAVHQWITPRRLKSLALFLSNWAADNVDDGGVNQLTGLNSVQIMTVHGAKGLEWPVVFLPRISSMIFPSSQRNRGPDTFLSGDTFDPKLYAGGDDGERRLWYVALTRCAKFLNISSLDRPRKRPTKYFNEIDHDCVTRNAVDPTQRRKVTPQAPANAELLPTTYSDLAAFWRCEYEYRLRSLMNFSPGVGEQFGYGEQVHNILAEIHEAAIAEEFVCKADVRLLVERRFHLRYTTGGPLVAMREAAIRGLESYVENFGDLLREARTVEKTFELIDAESGALISGVIDLLEKVDKDNPTSQKEILGLVDFKSRSISTKSEYDAIASAAEDQLRLYALGVRHALFMEPAEAAVHVIAHSPWPEELKKEGLTERIPIDVSEVSREGTRVKIADTVGKIREGLSGRDFRRTGVVNRECGQCDFRMFCKGFDQFMRIDKSAVEISPEEAQEYEVDQLMERTDAGA